MKKIHYLLCGICLCILCNEIQAQNWELKDTRSYGTGGRWENGQKVRIDCSFTGGVFLFERKESIGNRLSVYSTSARFAVPKDTYAAGEDLSVSVSFSEEGSRGGFVPYARVTVVSGHPASSPEIPASGAVEGQAVDAVGRFIVTPPETVTLMATALSYGTEMSIVYSCNGMDVVYMYERNAEQGYAGAPLVEDRQTGVEESIPVPEIEEEQRIAGETQERATDMEAWLDEVRTESFPLLKLIIVILVAAGLIALILIIFRKKVPEVEQSPAESPETVPAGLAVCPSCGRPVQSEAKFCEYCGHKLKDR